MEIRRWLVVDPAKDEIRVVTREPALVRGQAAFPLVVRIPDSQKRIFTDRPITLTMPGWTPPEVEVGGAEGVEESLVERTDEAG